MKKNTLSILLSSLALVAHGVFRLQAMSKDLHIELLLYALALNLALACCAIGVSFHHKKEVSTFAKVLSVITMLLFFSLLDWGSISFSGFGE